MFAAGAGHTEAAKVLLDAGADVNARLKATAEFLEQARVLSPLSLPPLNTPPIYKHLAASLFSKYFDSLLLYSFPHNLYFVHTFFSNVKSFPQCKGRTVVLTCSLHSFSRVRSLRRNVLRFGSVGFIIVPSAHMSFLFD